MGSWFVFRPSAGAGGEDSEAPPGRRTFFRTSRPVCPSPPSRSYPWVLPTVSRQDGGSPTFPTPLTPSVGGREGEGSGASRRESSPEHRPLTKILCLSFPTVQTSRRGRVSLPDTRVGPLGGRVGSTRRPWQSAWADAQVVPSHRHNFPHRSLGDSGPDQPGPYLRFVL